MRGLGRTLYVALIGLAAACSQVPSKMILGAWQEQGGKELLEFFKDGTVSVNGAIVGDYSFLDEKRIKLNLTSWGALAGPQMFTADVNKAALALTDSRGKTSVYSRTASGGGHPAAKGAEVGPVSAKSLAEVPTPERGRSIAELRKVADELINEIAAKADDGAIKEMIVQISQGRDRLKTLSREQLRAASGEGATKGNLGAIRSALSIYYGDLEGRYPAALDQLTINGKYLATIPSADMGQHPKSNSGIFACAPSELKDTGGWAYCNKPKNKNYGSVWVDCTHRDSKGTQWFNY